MLALQLDSQKLYQEIAVYGARLLDAEQALVYSMVDNRYQREAWFPASAPDWPPAESFPEAAIEAIRNQHPVLTQPALQRPPLGRRQQTGSQKVRNSILAPMIGTQNNVLGILEFRNKKRGAFFDQSDLMLAELLARMATSAVDRGRLFGRMEEWSQSIEMLLAFNATVNQHLRPQEMVRQLVVNATGFVDADGGIAGLAIYEGNQIAMEADGFYFGQRWYPFTRRWKLGEGVPGGVLQTEFPILIENYRTSPIAEKELGHQFDLGPCICVAIKNAAEKVLGFFQLHRRTDQPNFTWQEAALLETLGNTAAVAIENARLVKSLELKNEQVKNLSAANVRQLELERQHIARELHDETGQVLVGLKLQLQLLAQRLPADQQDAKQEIGSLQTQISEAAVRLKNLAKLLRPPTLDELGFEATLRQLVADYRKQVQIQVQLTFTSCLKLTPETETALYRIVQEGLTNIAKHASATNVQIRVGDERDRVFLEIVDDGHGFDLSQSPTGLGLVGIRERAKMLDGEFEIESRLETGTRIRVSRIMPQE